MAECVLNLVPNGLMTSCMYQILKSSSVTRSWLMELTCCCCNASLQSRGGKGASPQAVLDMSTRPHAFGIGDNQHFQRKLVNAAIDMLTIEPTYVVERLGSRDRAGLQRLREICSAPMSSTVPATKKLTKFKIACLFGSNLHCCWSCER